MRITRTRVKKTPSPGGLEVSKRKVIDKNSVSWLKKACWTEMSIHIRTRDMDDFGFVKCCSCGARKFWRDVDAGHFIDGRKNMILFDVRNIHAQCKACNGNLSSRSVADVKKGYRDFMITRYGVEVVKELEDNNRKYKSFSATELKQLLAKLKESNSRVTLIERS